MTFGIYLLNHAEVTIKNGAIQTINDGNWKLIKETTITNERGDCQITNCTDNICFKCDETTTTTLPESQLIFGIAHPINLKEGDEYCYPLPSEPNCRWEEGLDGKFREFCYSTLEINEVCYVKE